MEVGVSTIWIDKARDFVLSGQIWLSTFLAIFSALRFLVLLCLPDATSNGVAPVVWLNLRYVGSSSSLAITASHALLNLVAACS